MTNFQSSIFNSENPCGSARDRKSGIFHCGFVIGNSVFSLAVFRLAGAAIRRQKHLEFSGQSGMMGR
jgi:hypothetical protein